MSHPISAIEGHYFIIGITPLRGTFVAHGKNNTMDSTNHRDNLKMNSNFQLDGIASIPMNHADPTPLPTPVVNSVWLEQGEYFFDDEFAVPFDTNLVDPCGRAPPSCMTQSLVDPSTTRGPLQIDQSRSDSCIFTPGDSGESGLASGQTERTQSSGETDPAQMKETKGPKNQSQPVNRKIITSTTEGLVSSSVAPSIPKGNTSPQSNQNGVMDTNPIAQNTVANGTSVTGSQASGQSGSTSWMQMIMDRSCNPDLKALLNRTAAAVDYKLAYAEAYPTDSSLNSSIRQLTGDKSPLFCNPGTCGLSRSLSQGNLLTVAGLAGLRHALNQTTQYLLKDTAPHVRSVGVTAELTSGGNSGPATGMSSCADVNTSNTTTWAQKHGSRESLKRKSNKTNEPSDPAPTSVPSTNQPNTEVTNPWREMKKASGTLITWNQLKRTIKSNQTGLERATTFRESRKEQHQNIEKINQAFGNLVNAKSTADGGTAVRSRSQPVSNGHYMHRFSGTLLEIFMRAKAEEMTFLNANEDERGVTRCHAVSLDQTYDLPMAAHLNNYANRNVTADMTFGRRNGSSKKELGNTRSESDKHPLLRGDRILPPKWYPNAPSTTPTDPSNDQRSACNFGAQFPSISTSVEGTVPNTSTALTSPQSPGYTPPIWSNGLPVRRTSATAQAANYPLNRHSHPRNPSLPGRPQHYGYNKLAYTRRLQEAAVEEQSSTGAPPGVAACLTASAGPDSPYMAALRADYVADGYSAGWLGNPRASIAYPGLGLLSIPRPSRLTSASFLSHTLPDLSFLTQAAEEERKGTPTMPKRLVACRCLSSDRAEHCCARCGCRSLSVGRAQKCKHKHRNATAKSTRRPESELPTASSESNEDHENRVHARSQKPRTSDPPPVIPDLVLGHKTSTRPSAQNEQAGSASDKQSLVEQNMCHVERSTSEPDLKTAVLASAEDNRDTDSPADVSYTRPSALMTSSTQECYDWDSYKSSDNDLFQLVNRPKKSVSFSGKIRSLRLHNLPGEELEDHSPASPEPRLIPRNWGLYGQDTPLAEFNPRNSPGRDAAHGTELTQQSDVDIRYHDTESKHRAMVNDVIKAVQEMVAYLSNTKPPNNHRPRKQTGEPLPFSMIAALGSTGHQSLLSVIGPLTVLLSDGLLPPTKLIFTSKPRTRLWQMVEESCRPGPHLTGVAYHILSDAVSQVKALTNVTVEKLKFKAFICACLNAKALPIWLNTVVANDVLLRRFYCEDAFVRQCRSSQRGLHADLMTHLEQLLSFPFNLDLAVEVRKPLVDLNSVPKSTPAGETNAQQHQPTTTTTANHNSAGATKKEATASNDQSNKATPRPNIPPAVLMTRKQPLSTAGAPNHRNRFSPPPVPTASSQNPTIHHYPQHHLPGQRTSAVSARPGVPSRLSRPGNHRPGDDSGASSASSEPHSTNNVKAHQPRAVNTSTGSTNGSNPSTRGRFKSALSTFRRTTPTPPSSSAAKTSGSTDNPSTVNANRSSRTPLSDSQSTKPNGMDSGRPRTSTPTASKTVSKLKQPSTVVGRR